METDRIIQLVRWKEGDTDETRYSDFELVEALNEALRYVGICLANRQSDIIEHAASYTDAQAGYETRGAPLPEDFTAKKGVYREGNHYRLHAASDDHVDEDTFRLFGERIYAKGTFCLHYYGRIPPAVQGGEVALPDTFLDALVKVTRMVLNNSDVDTMTQAVAQEVDSVIPRRKWNNARPKLPFYV